MMLHCGLLLLILNCVTTTQLEKSLDYDRRFSLWPSLHNGARVMSMRKRDVQGLGASEGGGEQIQALAVNLTDTKSSTVSPPTSLPTKPPMVNEEITKKVENVQVSKAPVVPIETTAHPPIVIGNDTLVNVTTPVGKTMQVDLNQPGVLMRGLIVFGGISLLAFAYFIFYRKNGSKNDTTKNHNSGDQNQFRYGVLGSDEKGNMESSRIPLTLDSDDEDDDLEIFDLGQKKKSLSYVNLKTSDEDVVLKGYNDDRKNYKENLLLDIEDVSTDSLINWSNNGSKSIL